MLKIAFTALMALLVGAAGSWFLRGEFDRLVWGNNQFHVMNTADKPFSVTLVFPSKVEHVVTLTPGQSEDIHVDETGEGSIAIKIGGKVREQVGYVTTMNPLTVLAIGANKTHFSQVFFNP